MPGLDIFGALTFEKKQKKETAAAKAPETKINGNMVTNSKSKVQVSATYSQRLNRGQTRAIYNEGVTKMSGQYNPEAKVEITIHGSQRPFDMLNLTSLNRTQFLQDQFELIEESLKKQLCTETFEEFMSPAQSC